MTVRANVFGGSLRAAVSCAFSGRGVSFARSFPCFVTDEGARVLVASHGFVMAAEAYCAGRRGASGGDLCRDLVNSVSGCVVALKARRWYGLRRGVGIFG